MELMWMILDVLSDQAEKMAKKADAWKEYKEAAMVDMMLQTLPKAIKFFRNKILHNLPKPIHLIKTTDDNDTKLCFISLMAMMVNMMLKAIRLCFKSTKKKF